MKFLSILVFLLSVSCSGGNDNTIKYQLQTEIQNDKTLDIVLDKAYLTIKDSYNAGDNYNQVWIRDLNTFIELSCSVSNRNDIRDSLLMFLKFQGHDGNIVDGYFPYHMIPDGVFFQSALAPGYFGYKNNVETDQESSLIQAIGKYVKSTHDYSILYDDIGGMYVIDRLELAMDYLMREKYSNIYGLIYGATTIDWGDVQPEHSWGVLIDNNTHYAIDIYDNAMFVLAINSYIELTTDQKKIDYWSGVRDNIKYNSRRYLWDVNNNKFIPHIYLNGSPFPSDFNENEIYYHGGTAVAIEADILTKDEVIEAYHKMRQNVESAKMYTIGMTIYPTYPNGYFSNPIMFPFGYQNGGDWDWFGGRMVQQLIRYGYINEAYTELKLITDRVLKNGGFFEWYDKDNIPRGSGMFKGAAGVIGKSILMLKNNS